MVLRSLLRCLLAAILFLTLVRRGEADPKGVYLEKTGGLIAIFPVPEEPGGYAMVEVETGNMRALLPVENDVYSYGPALLIPKPTQGSVRFHRSAEGEVVALTHKSSEETLFERMELREEEIAFENDEVRLSGTVVFPEGKGPFPGVVMLHGSDPETREGNRSMSYLFASHGIAALIFDKRGTGRSTGQDWRASVESYAKDALSGFDKLAEHPQVDAARIGFWGHSQGAWVSALAGSTQKRAAFCILECGGAVDVIETTQWWARCFLQAKTDLTSEQIEAALVYRRIKYELVAGKVSREKLDAETPKVRNEPWFPNVTERLPSGVWWETMSRYDPRIALQGLRHCSVLAIYAEHDDATPTRASVEAITSVLGESDHPNYEIHEFENANHGLFETKTGARLEDEFEKTERLVSGYVSLLTSWVRQVNGIE